jgi:hypothetical protein
MTIEDYLADPASRFATVAMTDTNGLLRGQMVSTGSLKGIARNGMGMAPAQLALDPTDVMLTIPGVNDDTGDFHDDTLLQVDPTSVRSLPWSKPGYDLLVLSNYVGASAADLSASASEVRPGTRRRSRDRAEIRHGAGIHAVRRDARNRARQGLPQPQDGDRACEPRSHPLPGRPD